jgi:ribonucleoside-diphosphate reductase alpha chain
MLRSEGSVQDVDWLTDHEKSVFLTAFEIDQKVIIRLASQRQRWIDQGQSLNLFFAADCPEEEIARVHQLAFLDERILALYYIRSSNSNKASSGEAACESCAS